MDYTAYVNIVSLNDNTTIATLLSSGIHISRLGIYVAETAGKNEKVNKISTLKYYKRLKV